LRFVAPQVKVIGQVTLGVAAGTCEQVAVLIVRSSHSANYRNAFLYTHRLQI